MALSISWRLSSETMSKEASEGIDENFTTKSRRHEAVPGVVQFSATLRFAQRVSRISMRPVVAASVRFTIGQQSEAARPMRIRVGVRTRGSGFIASTLKYVAKTTAAKV